MGDTNGKTYWEIQPPARAGFFCTTGSLTPTAPLPEGGGRRPGGGVEKIENTGPRMPMGIWGKNGKLVSLKSENGRYA